METTIIFPSDTEKNREQDSISIRPFSTFNSDTFRSRSAIAIVAASKEFAIGRAGDIPWRLPEDLAHFKNVTMGQPVIMGRKTWESLPKRPLPGRRNIVVTRNADFKDNGCETAVNPVEALNLCQPGETPFFIGGGEIYRLALPFCSKVIMTEVDIVTDDADTYFPDLNPTDWRITDSSDYLTSKNGLRYRFVTYCRIR